MNVVMTAAGRYVEVQGTGESVAFSEAELKALLGWRARASSASSERSDACSAIRDCCRPRRL